MTFFLSPQVSPGHRPLTKKPEDSGNKITGELELQNDTVTQRICSIYFTDLYQNVLTFNALKPLSNNLVVKIFCSYNLK